MDIAGFAVNLLFPDIVVGSVIEQLHPTAAQHIRKGILNHKAEEQAVGKPEVRGISGNRPEPLPRVLRRTVFRYGINLIPGVGQSGGIDFLADPAVQQPAVMPDGQRPRMEHHHHGPLPDVPGICSLPVINLRNPLYLQKMIAAPDGPDLVVIGQLSITAYEILQPFRIVSLQAPPEHRPVQPLLLFFGLIIPP